MSLDFYLEETPMCPHCGKATGDEQTVYDRNITHNLNTMFDAVDAGGGLTLYRILWHGDGMVAGAVLQNLEAGELLMRSDRAHFERLNPENGWGDYDGAIRFLRDVISACREHPRAVIRCSR